MLNSLYEKAIAMKGFIHDIDSETDVESQLDYKWFDKQSGISGAFGDVELTFEVVEYE